MQLTMKGKILDAWYTEPEDVISADGKTVHSLATAHVYKETKYGVFFGEATAALEDEDIANQWDGYRFAEMKCDIQAYKAKAKVMKERALGVRHAYDVIVNSFKDDDFNLESEVLYKLNRQVQIAWRDYEKALHHYKIFKEMYPDYCDQIVRQRREFRNK